MNAPRRIGLLGGSFDPPHRAHLALAQCALTTLALDEVRWLPAGAPWQKLASGRRLASAADRCAMVEALIRGHAGHVVDARETRRSGHSYTVDTLRELQAEQAAAAFWLLMGQDAYARLDTWHDWQGLLACPGLAGLAVAARAGEQPLAPAAVSRVPHTVQVLPLAPHTESATSIRALVAAGGDPSTLVGAPVARYIADHALYRGQPAPDHHEH